MPALRGRRRAAALLTALAATASVGIACAQHAAAASTTYYVDCSATGNGSGTQASPWNSLSAVDTPAFGAGDQILFARGTTCNGTLTPHGSGTNGAPIVIDAYGTGAKPIIAGGGAVGSDAVTLSNEQYIEVRDLEVTNHGSSAGIRRGVHVVLKDFGTGTHYRLTNLSVHDVNGDGTKDLLGSAGIQFDVLGTAVQTKFDDVIVDGNEVYNVNRSGINMSTTWLCRASMGWISYSKPAPDGEQINCSSHVYTYVPWTGFVVRNNTVHSTGGDGIVMQYTKNGLADHNVTYDIANQANGSNAAIWVWNADNVTFQYNEAYNTRKLPDNNDGMAWDADFGTNGTVYQYNYSHDNAGGMAMYCGCAGGTSATDNAVFRYNVSQNDGAASNSQILRTYGATNGLFHNNTIYLPSGSAGAIVAAPTSENGNNSSVTMANNIIVNNGSGGYAYTPSAWTFTNNIVWGSQTGVPSGQIAQDPQLVAPNTGGTGLGTVAGYQIAAASPAVGHGTVIPNNGGRDFWGHPLPAVCSPDIGADQVSSPSDASCAVAKNGGFESGTQMAPWYAWNSAASVQSNARTGSWALQVGPAPASAEQIVTLTPDTTYQISGWAKVATSGEQVHIGVKNYGGTETYASITGTGYANGTVTFRTGPTSTQATIYCYKATGAGNAWCDDVTVAAATAPTNLIQGVGSGRCVNDPALNATDGTQQVLFDCGGGAIDETWSVYGDGTLRLAGHKCLTAASNTSTAPVTVSTCGNASGQQWAYDPATKELSPYSGMCLDATGAGTGNSTALIIYACSGHSNQQWNLVQPAN